MDNNFRYDNPFKPTRRAFWVRIIILGSMIYLATTIAFTVTGNPNLFPTFALVGNFIIPVAFVAFFYERRNRFNISMTSTALSFIFGGVLG
ncbi:MAG TPA: PrsW family intramembrane metalloprotease, partial [Clostridia bacterium]|nr:PrsW family intramembrane metalloprotease [Clostridia bacterium]